jgi:hypothetical protein
MKTFRCFLLACAVVFQAGCGLPDTYYLQPPSPVALAPGPGYFQFTNPKHDTDSDINATFLGNELFYKFYPSNAVDTNAYDSANPSDASVQLLAKGFFPVCLSSDQSPNRSVPLIEIDSGVAAAGSTTVTVNIQPTSASTATNYVLEADAPVEIRRKAVQDNLVNYKTFQDNNTLPPDNYAPNDSDIGQPLYQSFGASGIFIAMYAISYGEIIGNQTPVRSAAVYLGYLNFTFIP